MNCEGHGAGAAESIQERRVRMRSDQTGSVEIGINLETKIKSLRPGDKTIRQETKLCRNWECSKQHGREKEENPTSTTTWFSNRVNMKITQKPNKTPGQFLGVGEDLDLHILASSQGILMPTKA